MRELIKLIPEEIHQFEANIPRLKWRGSGWWLTACGTVAALITILLPSISQYPAIIRGVITVFSFIVAPLAIVAGIYFSSLVSVIFRRVMLYGTLYKKSQAIIEQLNTAQETILALRSQVGNVIAIHKIQYYKNEIHIIIKKKRGLKLENGNLLVVIDTSDGMVMGHFKVIEVRQNEYIAKSNGYVDALWQGYVYQTGESEIHTPPYTAAFLIKEDSNNDAQ